MHPPSLHLTFLVYNIYGLYREEIIENFAIVAEDWEFLFFSKTTNKFSQAY
jgi:hypothetical protein